MKEDRVTIIHGPQGGGKTLGAAVLQAFFGLETVIDEWDGNQPLPPNALVLTHVSPPYVDCADARVLSHEDALAMLGSENGRIQSSQFRELMGCGHRFRIPYTLEYVNCGPDQLCEDCATAST